MSTLATAELSSDDEADLDFQLPDRKSATDRKRRRSGSASSSGSSTSDEQNVGVAADEARQLAADQATLEAEERRIKADAAFAAMKNGTNPSGASGPTTRTEPAELVEIRRTRWYAGETIVYVHRQSASGCSLSRETVKLPADDPEVIEYQKRNNADSGPQEVRLAMDADVETETPDNRRDLASGPSKSKAKPPARRKPRQSLEAMSAALDRGKKMTTLEKVRLHSLSRVAASGIKHGSYLLVVPDGLAKSHQRRQVDA